MTQPLCFVLMPFGVVRPPGAPRATDFDHIYAAFIKPAIEAAELQPIRADQELRGGIFHKSMFERLSLCEYAVADLSLSNPNVFYELGIRHARREWSTVLLYQSGTPLPLDVALVAAMPYDPTAIDDPEDNALIAMQEDLTRRLQSARDRVVDSPVFQLVAGLSPLDVEHTRLDALVASATTEDADTRRIAVAAKAGVPALVAVRAELGDLGARAPEVVGTLVKAFRDRAAWNEVVATIEASDVSMASTWVMREMLAQALGRLDRFDEAVTILHDLLRRRPSSETLGLLGGTYKRQWRASVQAASPAPVRQGYRRKAAEAYRKGFETDWRDPYPGINAVMLRAIDDPATPDSLVEVVRYAVERRLERPDPEYWDFACALELAILRGDQPSAEEFLGEMLMSPERPFDPSSTTADLMDLLPVCRERGNGAWVEAIIDHLEQAS